MATVGNAHDGSRRLASVSTVTLAGCGGGEGGTRQAEQLSQPERVAQAQRGTVSITGTGTAVDAEKKKVASEAGGSGVIIDAGRGLILTNNHVISGLTSARAKVGGSESTLQVVGRAPCQDLAVLRMTAPPSGIKQLKLGDSDKLKPGEHVTALGFPGSIEDEDFSDRSFSATEGSVSTVKTTVAPSDDYPRLPNVIRHQAPISSGNSGGPLLNDAGEVVGINTGSDETEGSQSQNVAVASTQAKSLLEDLKAGKDRSYLGWGLVVEEVKGEKSLYVSSVDAGSPADDLRRATGGRDRVRFVPSDMITEVDGTPVKDVADVCDILESKTPGDTLTVKGFELDEKNKYQEYDVRAKLEG